MQPHIPPVSYTHLDVYKRQEVHSDGSATASILPCEELYGQKILVPGDISSAAYFIAAALLVPGSELLIKNVGTNPTRAGILEVCRAMGADITYLNENCDSGEPTADLLVRTSALHGTTVEGAIIPTPVSYTHLSSVHPLQLPDIRLTVDSFQEHGHVSCSDLP